MRQSRRKRGKIGWFSKFLLFLLIVLMGITALFFVRDFRDLFVNDHLFDAQITESARRYSVDSRLIRAVIFEESRFDPTVRGQAGEVGLMQILPTGAVQDWARNKKIAVPSDFNLFYPSVNIEIGTWYLSRALFRWRDYKSNIELALCQYNAGESRANKWKPKELSGDMIDNIEFKSTKNYVSNIMKRYQRYCENDIK